MIHEEEFDPADLFGTGLVDEIESEQATALQHVAQRISGQYGELIATWSARVFASSSPAETAGMVGTATNLLRLAESSEDTRQQALLTELLEILRLLEGTQPCTRRGETARVRLRDWLPAFANTLTGEDAERLLSLVQWDDDATPLLEELRGIPGVGPRRLTRLYSAGLGNVDVVASASPSDIAAVTGIPLSIAERIVERSRDFALHERERCIQDIHRRAMRLKSLLATMGANPDPALVEAARAALSHVEGAFQNLIPHPPSEDS